MEESGVKGVDPIGVSGGRGSAPLSAAATVYPLRSTFESDGFGLREWGLLREGVRVFAVFYMTRWEARTVDACRTSRAWISQMSVRTTLYATSLR